MAETRLNTCIEAMLAEFDRWHGSSDPLVDRAVRKAVFHLARGAIKAANGEQAELRHALTEESTLVRELGARLADAHDRLARVEALHTDDGSGYCGACPSLTLWPEECRTRSALTS